MATKKKAAGKKKVAKKSSRSKPGPDGFLGEWRLFACKLRNVDRELIREAAKSAGQDESSFVRSLIFDGLERRNFKPSGRY